MGVPSDAVVGAAVMGAVVWHLHVRRCSRRRPVRRALRSADAEIRRAALLVASCDGLRRHLRPLRHRARHETDETVLEALAQVVREGLRKPGRRRCRRGARLLVWADRRASAAASGEAAPDDEHPPERRIPPPALHLIDPLDLVETLTSAAPATPQEVPSLEPVTGRWRAPARRIDALEVLDVLALCAASHPTSASGAGRRGRRRRPWRAGPDGIDPLLASDLGGGDDQRPAGRRRTRQQSAASG